MTKKVAVAESSAMPTATAPTSREAGGMGGAGAAAAADVGSMGTTCSTVVMKRS